MADVRVEVKSPLGAGALLLERLTFVEGLSTPFEAQLTCLSTDLEIDLEQLLGKQITVSWTTAEGERFLDGIAFAAAQVGQDRHYAEVQISVRPWLELLDHSPDCRVFQNLDAIEIVRQVCEQSGFTDIDDQTQGALPKYGYCVQYRETDFQFVSRLLEQEGIYTSFRHEDGEHTLVLGNDSGAHKPIAGYDRLQYHPVERSEVRESDFISSWLTRRQVVSGAVSLRDYDFERPTADLETMESKKRHATRGDLERFDYPGRYAEKKDGSRYAEVRLREVQRESEGVEGSSNARGLTVGATFELFDHPRTDQNDEYLVVHVEHTIEDHSHRSSDRTGIFYENRFRAIPKATPFSPPRSTPKPEIRGPQTAVVVGKSGEEIHTDEHGRIKVQFHWDRHGKKDENSSCWLRVAQVWAGKGWGGIAIPRLGQEVIVEFLEADPDRPIVTGSVYNGEQTPPYELQKHKTQSGFKTRSTKSGSANNYNEIRFEDQKGEEELHLQAEKDHTITVKNDRTLKVGHDESTEIENDRREKVGNDETGEIAENQTWSIGNDQTLTVGGKRTISVKDDDSLKVSASRKVDVAKDISVEAGKKITIEAGDTLVLQAGKSKITLKKDGAIQIEGKDLTLKGSGKIDAKASGALTLKGSKVTAN